MTEYIETKHVDCPINDKVIVKFETDAEDNYFNEHTGIGKIDLNHDIIDHQTLKKGIFSLKLRPSITFPKLVVGQIINFRLNILEKSKNRFNFEIPIKITEAIQEKPKPPRPPKPPIPPTPQTPFTREIVPDEDPDDQGRWNPPIIETISKEGKQEERWNEMFEGNLRRGAYVEIKSDETMVIWINISHPSLVRYQEKHPEKTKPKLVEQYANYIGLTIYATYCIKEGKIIKYPDTLDVKDMMEATSDALALFGLIYNDASR